MVLPFVAVIVGWAWPATVTADTLGCVIVADVTPLLVTLTVMLTV
jgi:hypothetical protein